MKTIILRKYRTQFSCCSVWIENGRYHKIGAPAVIWSDGFKEWWQEGLLHREGGPALEKYCSKNEWFINGIKIKEEVIDEEQNK